MALIAAGNTHVPSDHPQAWGDPDIDDDLKAFGNFGYTLSAGVQMYAHTSYARKKIAYGVFFRNPNTRLGVFSIDRGRTLLVGDVLAVNGMGSADCPTVAVTDHVPDPVALRQVSDDPNCFTFQELFPGGFTPQTGGTATDASLVGGVRGFAAGGFNWDLSASLGMHRTDHFVHNTINASLGLLSPTAFDVGRNRQRDVNVNFDGSYAVTDRVNIAAGAEWRDERYGVRAGDRAGWTIGPYAAQGFMGGSNAVFAYSPAQAGTWSRHNVAAYGDLEVTDPGEAWTLGAAVRIEDFEDFGTTTNGKVSGRVGFVRGSVSTGFRAPTPGQQQGVHIQSWFDPTVGDLVNNAVIPSISPVARLRGGLPLGPEQSVNYTAGVVLGTGPFTLTADYFRIDVSDRLGITSNFTLTPAEIAEVVAGGFEAARSVRNYRFFTNAFATTSQGVDVVSTWTPLALRGNTVISAVFNHTDTEVTDNARGLLDGRRLAEYAYALPRTRWNAGVTQRVGRGEPAGPPQLLQRLVRLRQRARNGLRSVGRAGAGLLRRPADRRPGAERPPRTGDDAGRRRAERLRHLLAGVGHRPCRRRAVQRVHAVGLQRRVLLRAHRLRLGRVKEWFHERPSSRAGVGFPPALCRRRNAVDGADPRAQRAGGHRHPDRHHPDSHHRPQRRGLSRGLGVGGVLGPRGQRSRHHPAGPAGGTVRGPAMPSTWARRARSSACRRRRWRRADCRCWPPSWSSRRWCSSCFPRGCRSSAG